MSAVRGLVHVHSSYSYDCTVPLREIRGLARRRRLSFIVQTEHSNRLTADDYARYREEVRSLCEPAFLMMASVEYASRDNRIHVLALGVDRFWEDLRLFPPEAAGELLSRIREAGGLAILAHPERGDAIEHLPRGFLDAVDGVEVWNGKTDLVGPSPRGLAALERYRRAGNAKVATIGLDLHDLARYVPAGLELPAMPSDEADLVRALREHRFRGFFGPLRWDPARAGTPAHMIGLGSRWAVASVRACKRRLRGLASRTS